MAPHRVTVAILALVGLFLVALVGMRLTALAEERAAALSRAEAGMGSLARVTEQYAYRVFEGAQLAADQVAQRVAAAGGTARLAEDEGMHSWLAALSRRSAGDYLLVVDAAGMPVATSQAHTAPRVDLSDRRWFRVHREGGETLAGEALFSRITGELLFTYSRALRRPDGAFDGAVQIAVRSDFFQATGPAAQFGGGTALGLFDAAGRVLAHTGLTPDRVGMTLDGSSLAAAMAGAAGEGVVRAAMPHDGAERIVAFRRLQAWPLLVTASVPVAEVLAPWRRSVRAAVEILGAVALGLVALAALAVRLANREAHMRDALAAANAALREAAAGLEARVAARTSDLAASERRFRVIFDSTFQLTALLDRQGNIVEANETALRFLGLTRVEVLGRRMTSLPCWAEATTREGLARALLAAGTGAAQRREVTARTLEGRIAPLEVSLRPVFGAAGEVVWLVAEAHDLTELKAAEARLREAQKTEALGQLTGGVAHDFNNLLMVVLGNLGLLRKRLAPDPVLIRLLDGAQQGAERGAALTGRMLAFARRQDLRPAPFDLAGLVRGMMPLLERSAGSRTRIELRLPPGLPPALADAGQIEVALLNLVVNARDAMPAGGVIEIGVAAGEAPAPDAPAGLGAGRYLRLALRDSGAGMDPQTLARATDPFFTTKQVGQGSGLGLSMVQGLAQQSGGALGMTSRPGAGTTVEIWLPRAEGAIAEAGAPRLPAAGPPRRVLVVDDDPLVGASTAMMLEDLGHNAVLAASAEEALGRLAREPRFELVLTDHAMPGMTGLEFAERLRRERPDLPVVLATGHVEAAIGANPWLPRLGKPYRQEDLDAVIRRLTPAQAA